MIFAELASLADSLDKKGHRDLADLVDGILSQAHDGTEEEEAAEAPHDEAEEHDEGEEVEEVVDAPSAEAPAEVSDQDGMIAPSWYGQKEDKDLSPVQPGSMQDHRSPLPTDQPGAPTDSCPPAEAPEGSEDEGDEAVVEAASKLVDLASTLDSKGYSKEADMADQLLEALASLKKR